VTLSNAQLLSQGEEQRQAAGMALAPVPEWTAPSLTQYEINQCRGEEAELMEQIRVCRKTLKDIYAALPGAPLTVNEEDGNTKEELYEIISRKERFVTTLETQLFRIRDAILESNEEVDPEVHFTSRDSEGALIIRTPDQMQQAETDLGTGSTRPNSPQPAPRQTGSAGDGGGVRGSGSFFCEDHRYAVGTTNPTQALAVRSGGSSVQALRNSSASRGFDGDRSASHDAAFHDRRDSPPSRDSESAEEDEGDDQMMEDQSAEPRRQEEVETSTPDQRCPPGYAERRPAGEAEAVVARNRCGDRAQSTDSRTTSGRFSMPDSTPRQGAPQLSQPSAYQIPGNSRSAVDPLLRERLQAGPPFGLYVRPCFRIPDSTTSQEEMRRQQQSVGTQPLIFAQPAQTSMTQQASQRQQAFGIDAAPQVVPVQQELNDQRPQQQPPARQSFRTQSWQRGRQPPRLRPESPVQRQAQPQPQSVPQQVQHQQQQVQRQQQPRQPQPATQRAVPGDESDGSQTQVM
jgi:hypothetical protein